MNPEKIGQATYSKQANGTKLFLGLLTAFLFVSGCKKEMDLKDASSNQDVLLTAKPTAPPVLVHTGSSIQAAVDAASPGSVIKIQPGTYAESIVINKPGISLWGEGQVVIQNPGNATIGITVQDAGDNFTLKNVTIRGFLERGVQLTYVDGFLLSHVKAMNNGEFGLFAEYCHNGVYDHCEGSGHAETGIFVGQSSHVEITQNEMHANVIGLEAENSSFIIMDKNHSYDNAVGILCLLVPGRTVYQSSNIVVTKNQVRENNHVNFAPPSEQESVLPNGIGILLLGIDNALVQDNHVNSNKFTGIAAVSSLVMALLANLPPEVFAGIEPNPDGLRVLSNQVKNNAFDPPAGVPLPGADLLWDGSGTDNCWRKNLFGSSFPSPLPACQ